MRISLGFLVLVAASQANAIGVCEEVEDSARVVGVGPDRVAVERVQELCDDEEGEERRRKLQSVEILDATGNTFARYAHGGTTPEEIIEAIGEARPQAELKSVLDALKPANPNTHPLCTVELKRGRDADDRFDVLTLLVMAKGVKEPLHAQDLTEYVDPKAPTGSMLKTFWLPVGAVVVEAQVPLLIDQGALGNAPGKLSTVLVLGPEVIPALAACKAPPAAPATAAPAKAPDTAAPATAP